MDTTKQPGIKIDQVYLTEARFAHREDALSLSPQTPVNELPVTIEVKLLQLQSAKGEKGAAIALRAFTPDDASLLYNFHVEITAVVSAVSGEENLDPVEFAKGMGAAAFYPFLREAVANLTWKGRFGPVWLKPINLLALGAASPAEQLTGDNQVVSGHRD